MTPTKPFDYRSTTAGKLWTIKGHSIASTGPSPQAKVSENFAVHGNENSHTGFNTYWHGLLHKYGNDLRMLRADNQDPYGEVSKKLASFRSARRQFPKRKQKPMVEISTKELEDMLA